ncbi:hypothetical protein [Gimesia maris]|uniref:Ceramidase n=1 Tax=Gimesia maris TaxID=122 RepID=A0ABX5YT83_9PLAN|nr:hypothetical protein [Gimesia maris]EDL58861.1 hypothetical protein PM8797T_19979 [Gimesia maris DSM 8797]QEG18810.1 hypothetical protein GmarT_47030 [Gimesia maris]
MKMRFLLCHAVTLCVLVLTTTNLQAAETPQVKVGFAERDITPEIGMEQPGGYGKSFHRSFHDPCKVRVAVFDNGKNVVAVVSLDALFIRRVTVDEIRQRVEAKCKIPANSILLHATHSHSSGPMGMILPGEYDHASKFVQELAYEKSSTADTAYLETVVDQSVEAICEAYQKRNASECGAGVGIEEQVAFNRRFFMRNGLTYTHPRPGNPDIVKPAGPVDPEVGVIGVWDEQGQLKGCIVNFVCHATTNPGGISANYIYYVEQVIRGFFGKDTVVVFLAGASGDVTQVDNLSKFQRRPSEESSRFVGGRVGAEAVKVLVSMPRGNFETIASKTKMLKIPRRKPSREHLEEALEQVKAGPGKAGATNWIFAKETVLLDARLQKEPVADVEVQAVQLGPVVLLTDPAEFFCQLGLDIKEGSPFPITFPVSLANGCVGYVPTKEAFDKNGGGYETRLSSYSNLEITAGPQMVEAAVELSKELTPDKLPERPAAPAFSNNPWEYGNLPPQVD